MMNDALRSAVAADLAPVRPLAPPFARALVVVPLALLLLVAAPLVFDFRELTALGFVWSWGASTLQMVAGLAAIVLALREAVPGRGWSLPLLSTTLVALLLLFGVVTAGAWSASPVTLARYWWQFGALCVAGSLASALPVVVLSAVLIVRAYPVRPALAGGLAGFGGGLLADAGWRLFCHFSDPAHVLAAHLGGVALAAVAGATLTSWLASRQYAQIPGYTPK